MIAGDVLVGMDTVRPSRPATVDSPPPGEAAPVTAENLLCRNYDPFRRQSLTIDVVDGDGRPRFTARYSLRPGQVESVAGVLPPGTYEVTVGLRGGRRKTRQIRVGPAPEHTIHVEVGDGTLSLTEGLYGEQAGGATTRPTQFQASR